MHWRSFGFGMFAAWGLAKFDTVYGWEFGFAVGQWLRQLLNF